MDAISAPSSKHRDVYTALRRQLQAGQWKPGERIPTEAELIRQFRVSRITVGRAVRDLEAGGFVERRRGAGTFVKNAETPGQLSFGLLIPDLGETEIFEPICHGMMASPLARKHVLLWGVMADADTKEERAWHLCRQYIDRRVSGVFFAPLEHSRTKEEMNHRIARALDAAHIPIVLLDRGLEPYPGPDRYDLVGIDNRRAGFAVTSHLLKAGARTVAFVGAEHAAATVDEREAGYREALLAASRSPDRSLEHRLQPDNAEMVQQLMRDHRPDGIVCANDRIAGHLMHALQRLGTAFLKTFDW